jgi:transposase
MGPKFDDQLLLRLGEILARLGTEIRRSTLIDNCGEAAATVRVMSSNRLAKLAR